MGDFHVTCRIVGGFAGRYQLYYSKRVLNTSFSCTELIPVSDCSPMLLTRGVFDHEDLQIILTLCRAITGIEGISVNSVFHRYTTLFL